MGNIFTRKALSDIMANEGLTPEQRTEQVMGLYGRALDDGYVSKSAAQTAQETALENARKDWEKGMKEALAMYDPRVYPLPRFFCWPGGS